MVLYTGSNSTEPVDVHEQCQHNHDSSSGNTIAPTQDDKTSPCNKHNGYKDTQTGYTKQTNEASNITQDGSSDQVASYDIHKLSRYVIISFISWLSKHLMYIASAWNFVILILKYMPFVHM